MLLVPVVIPVVLLFTRAVKDRSSYPPSILEIVIPLAIWSIIFEFLGPYYIGRGTSDPLDVVAYFFGGLVSWIVWNKMYCVTSKRSAKNGCEKG
jgi:hypothetical protein